MRVSSLRATVLCFLGIAVSLSAQAQELTPEQQKIFDQMIRNSGGDPAQVNAARAQVQAASQFSDIVRYSVVGIYQGQTNVSADSNWMAFADVGDRIEMQFDWKTSEAALANAGSIQNFKATLAKPRNPEPKCAPPTVNGPFEYDLKSIQQGIGGALRLNLQTSFPPVQVHQMCTGARKSIAANQKMTVHEFMVPPPTMLTMSLPAGGPVTLSSDRKSLVHRKDGWTWTFTPRSK